MRWRWLLGLGLGLGLLGGGGRFLFARRRKSNSEALNAPVPHPDPDLTVLSASHPESDSLQVTMPGLITLTQEGEYRLGRYVVRKILGKGACGITYLGVRDESGLEVAIKVPHPHVLADREFLARFRQEAEMGSHLIHPKIVRIIDKGPTEGTPWLAMELVHGTGLDEYLKLKGALGLPESLDIAIDVAEAITYAHAQGVVHRDLKPSNVMLSEKGAQVLDFGIARMTDGVAITATHTFLGTPLYASPESVKHSRVGPAADRYALGIMLFEFLAGKPPFLGPNAFSILQMHLSTPMPDLSEFRPHLAPKLLRLIDRLTDKRPEERPEDGEVVRILKQIRQGLGPT